MAEEGQKLPAGHGVAACMAGEGQKLPAGQEVQDGEAALPGEYDPAKQYPVGADRPAAEQKLPAVQSLQDDWPERS